jgi:Na+-transporting methylmalonyl-CoA/oxaloacetate decarboxylase gamma subunit
MDVGNMKEGLRIFAVGFGGVFVNLLLIMAAMRLLGWGVAAMEKKTAGSDKEK